MDFQNRRDFPHLHSTEEPHLHRLQLPFVELAQPYQGLVQRKNVHKFASSNGMVILERDGIGVAAALGGIAAARVIDQYPAHVLRGDGNQMGTAFPFAAALRQTHKCFVDQRGGLQRVSAPLIQHIVRREAMEFVHDQRSSRSQRLIHEVLL